MICFCWCYIIYIGHMIDSVWFGDFLRNCLLGPGSSRFRIAWFPQMLWSFSFNSRAKNGCWRRGMACQVRLESEPLMDCFSKQDETRRTLPELSTAPITKMRVVSGLSLILVLYNVILYTKITVGWECFRERKCLFDYVHLLAFASWISRCQCQHIWRCRELCLIKVAVCRP